MNESLEVARSLDDQTRAGLSLIGSVLGSFFLNDPAHDASCLEPGFDALVSLDLEAAAEWPFVAADQAQGALAQMRSGLEEGYANEALVWEYRRLFIGPAPKPAPPWGSVYTDKDRVVFGASTLELRAWMRKRGIAVAKTTSEEPEDHIGTMLVLLSWLSDERPDLVKEFLTDHLLTWSSHFLIELEKAAQHPFYEGLARLTRLSLEGIQEALDLHVEHSRYYR